MQQARIGIRKVHPRVQEPNPDAPSTLLLYDPNMKPEPLNGEILH